MSRFQPEASPRWAAMRRIGLYAVQLGLRPRDLLAAVFAHLRPPGNLRVVPPGSLSLERLRMAWRLWQQEHEGATEQRFSRDLAGPEGLRLMLAQVADSARLWARYQRAGHTVDSWLTIFGTTVSPWWAVLQPWWLQYRDQVLRQQQREDRREDFRNAERNAARYRHEILTESAKAAMGEAANTGDAGVVIGRS